MFIPRIYLPLSFQEGDTLLAPEKIAHYLIHVLRKQHGDPIILFNGQGGEYEACLALQKKQVNLIIRQYHAIQRQSSCAIHLGQSLLRGDKMDLVIQKATELGVTSITPLISHYCGIKLDEAKSQKRLAHWLNIAISASEQSGRTDIPTIHAPIPALRWAEQSFSGTSLVFKIGNHTSLKSLAPVSCFRIAIGPESGWHSSETLHWQTAGFTACQLGPRTLRTETAGIISVGLLQSLFGDA